MNRIQDKEPKTTPSPFLISLLPNEINDKKEKKLFRNLFIPPLSLVPNTILNTKDLN